MGEGAVRDLTREAMAHMMMGDAELPHRPCRLDVNGHSPPNIRLAIHELCADDETGVEALSKLSLSVGASEIVGIAGVSGNGQRELVQVLAGQREASGGRILVARRALPSGPPRNAAAPLSRACPKCRCTTPAWAT